MRGTLEKGIGFYGSAFDMHVLMDATRLEIYSRADLRRDTSSLRGSLSCRQRCRRPPCKVSIKPRHAELGGVGQAADESKISLLFIGFGDGACISLVA